MAVVTVTTLLGNHGDPVEYTIADGSVGTDIPKGTIMNINSSPKTITTAGADELVAGILAAEHVGGKGTTKVTVLSHFVGEFTAGVGATTFGQPQKLSGTNAVIDADDDTIDQKNEVVCLALETAADGDPFAGLMNLG